MGIRANTADMYQNFNIFFLATNPSGSFRDAFFYLSFFSSFFHSFCVTLWRKDSVTHDRGRGRRLKVQLESTESTEGLTVWSENVARIFLLSRSFFPSRIVQKARRVALSKARAEEFSFLNEREKHVAWEMILKTLKFPPEQTAGLLKSFSCTQ
jgi:hypothetical protein